MSSEEELRESAKKRKAKLENNNFLQQTLPCWRPEPTMIRTIVVFIVFGIIFLGMGIVLVQVAKNIEEISIPYNDRCRGDPKCEVPFIVEEDLKAPIYIYYKLDNLYQNHRRYVKSRDNPQLRGILRTKNEVSTSWDPVVTNRDMGVTVAWDKITQLDPDAPANPCGLIAKSFFNDEYELFDPNGEGIEIDSTKIAYEDDKKFKQAPDSRRIQWTNPTNEHFMVWMRTAGMPNFRKLWGQVDKDMPKGTYVFEIQNKYNVDVFDGNKSLVVTTTDSFGGKNTFLAVWYLSVGGLCMVFAVIFFGAHIRAERRKKQQ